MQYRCGAVPIFGPVTHEIIEAESAEEARLVFARKHGIKEADAEKYVSVETVVEAVVENTKNK
ncbi:MAG: hypothetical protein HUU29_05225 [Planctomycetaceae bacterium]|nr:hypothetical protein [Planctomycetaceae bacterium]